MLADRNIRLQESLDLIKKALDKDPENGAYLDSLGWVLFRLGRLPEAEENMRRAVVKTPRDPTVHDHMAEVLMGEMKVKEAVAQWQISLKEWDASPPADMDPAEAAKVKNKLENAKVRLAKETAPAEVNTAFLTKMMRSWESMFGLRLLSVLGVCAAGLVSTSTAAAQSKIAVVNWQKALTETQELKKTVADLTAKFKPRQDALEKAQRDLADIQTQLQSAQGKLSAAGQADLEAQGQRKQRDVERMSQDLQDDGEKERNDLIAKIGSRMTEVVKKLQDEKGLDVVMDTASLIAFKNTVDITTEAIAAYDKAYPVKP